MQGIQGRGDSQLCLDPNPPASPERPTPAMRDRKARRAGRDGGQVTQQMEASGLPAGRK
jgi:hypothetical protein